MSDYTPVYVPGRVVTLTASAAVSGGDLLTVSGSGTVAKASSASQIVVGVAASDTPINGRVTVYGRGIVHESVSDGSITAGMLITTTATANRQVAGFTLAALGNQDVTATPNQGTINTAINAVVAYVNADRAVMGVALTGASDNAKVRWMEFLCLSLAS